MAWTDNLEKSKLSPAPPTSAARAVGHEADSLTRYFLPLPPLYSLDNTFQSTSLQMFVV
ncbi:MAG: hypothetical protein LBF22_13130 [Deltaproteobacteria bacterium]|nr:hypothetical protein [Deltaproteobacteria bacterium]